MPRRKKGYRRFFSRTWKGVKPWELMRSRRKGIALNSKDKDDVSEEGSDYSIQEVEDVLITSAMNVAPPSADSVWNSHEEHDFLGFPGHLANKRIPIRCLSLCDGIATGKVALERLRLVTAAYISSEIDEEALAVQRYNFHDRIIQVGSMTDITAKDLDSFGDIHLLLAAPPCSDFSLVNPRRRGLFGKNSTGSLFFEFKRILDHLSKSAEKKGIPFYWLMENTFSMEKSVKEEISRQLMTQPVVLCSSDFTAMRRKRFFWGSLPQMDRPRPQKHHHLTKYIQPYREAAVDCLPTITTTTHSQLRGRSKCHPVSEDGSPSLLLLAEEEALFGFDKFYTAGPDLTLRARRRLLGKAWCVHVIEHLLQPLTDIFEVTI